MMKDYLSLEDEVYVAGAALAKACRRDISGAGSEDCLDMRDNCDGDGAED